MLMFEKCKYLFCISVILLTLGSVASANKCTDVWFTALANPYINSESEFHIDSSYFNEYENEWTHKYVYENGKIAQLKVDFKEDGEEVRIHHFYNDTNETVLKNEGAEYIVSKCQALDTLCYQEKVYFDGESEAIKTTKFTPKYITTEQVEDGALRFSEYILSKDTVIEKRYFAYNTDSVEVYQTFYIADSTDDFKCYQQGEDGVKDYTLTYKPKEVGFSVSVESKTYHREFFFVNTDKITSLRKTVKPVKMAPQARYFDLLGRFKFNR